MNNEKNKKFFSATLMIFLALLICKLLAFLQEIVIASKLGATTTGDAFNMLSGIQQVIYPMLSIGISQVFFPEYKGLLAQSEKKKANVLASYAILVFTTFSLVIFLCLILFSDKIVSFVAPGFDPAQHQQTAYMLRVSSPSYIFVCVASVISSILIANGHFFISEVRAAFSHISIIIAAILFYERFGITALALAVVIAGLLRLLVQIPFIHRDYSFSLSPRLERKYVRNLLKLLPPSLLSSGISQLNTFVDKMLASELPVGSVSCLNYGGRVFSVLRELMGSIISTSSYPQIIEYSAQNKKLELGKFLYEIINMMLIVTIPLSVGGLIYSKNIIEALFARGKFTTEMCRSTSSVFSFYLVALPFSSLRGIINNVYFANRNTKMPMFVNGANLIINVILNIVFMRVWGVSGLALSTTISSVICISYSLFNLNMYAIIDYYKTVVNIVKIIISTIISLLPSIYLLQVVDIDSSFVTVLIAIIITIPVYYFVVKFSKIDVFEKLIKCVVTVINNMNRKR